MRPRYMVATVGPTKQLLIQGGGPSSTPPVAGTGGERLMVKGERKRIYIHSIYPITHAATQTLEFREPNTGLGEVWDFASLVQSVDGDTYTIKHYDTTNYDLVGGIPASTTFEFDDDNSFTAGNIPVPIGATAGATGVNLVEAMKRERRKGLFPHVITDAGAGAFRLAAQIAFADATYASSTGTGGISFARSGGTAAGIAYSGSAPKVLEIDLDVCDKPASIGLWFDDGLIVTPTNSAEARIYFTMTGPAKAVNSGVGAGQAGELNT